MDICIKHDISDNANTNIVATFKSMFPDSFGPNKPMEKMRLSRTKTAYVTNHGFYPYYKNILQVAASKSPYIAVSYDESLNDALQKGQMDFIIRYWDEDSSQVRSRYWNSQFLGHAIADDLLEHFDLGLDSIDQSKLLHVSMDGPNVNLLLMKKLNARRSDQELKKLIDIGVCNLHVVHNAFKGK